MRLTEVCAGVCALLLSAGAASAITINDTFGTEGAAALGAPFLSVVRLDHSTWGPFCTGSLISSTAVLTARHCTALASAEEITVSFTDGTGESLLTRQVSGVASLTGGNDFEGGDFNGNDVSVLWLGEAVTGFAPFRLLARPMVGEIVRMVGFGDQGTGSVGAIATTLARWAADNVVDAIVQFEPDTMIFTDFDDPFGTSNTGPAYGFPSSPDMLPAEGTTAVGDSGGPLLFLRGEEWVIGGVLSSGTIPLSTYGDISFWNGLSSPETQALLLAAGATYTVGPELTPIPLPASGLLLLGGLAALAVRRRVA